MNRPTLTELACKVLTTANGREKTHASYAAAKLWFDSVQAGYPLEIGDCKPPEHPSRPEKPELLAPRDVPRRRTGTQKGRAALLHAIAHIELGNYKIGA